MESKAKRLASRQQTDDEATAGTITVTDNGTEYVNSEVRLHELMANSAQVTAEVAENRLVAEAEVARKIADSFKAGTKAVKREATAAADNTRASVSQVKVQGAQPTHSAADEAAAGTDKSGNGAGKAWTPNK